MVSVLGCNVLVLGIHDVECRGFEFRVQGSEVRVQGFRNQDSTKHRESKAEPEPREESDRGYCLVRV